MNNLLFVSNIHTIMDEFKNRILAEYRVELETVQDVSKSEKEDEVNFLRKDKAVLERTIGELKMLLENIHKERDLLRIENTDLKTKVFGQENMIGNMNVIIQSMGQRINGLTQLVNIYNSQYGPGPSPRPSPAPNSLYGDIYYPSPPLPPQPQSNPYMNYPQLPETQNNIITQEQEKDTLEQMMRNYQEKVSRQIYQEGMSGSKPDF